MTVPATYQPDVSTGNGVTTVFPYTFKILNAADLLVQVDGVTKGLTTDYAVDGVGDEGGGNVTFLVAPANGSIVVRARDMEYQRNTDYQEGGGFQADTVNDDFDRPVMLLQQLHDLARRSIALPLDSAIRDLVIPSPEAGKVLAWNADADALANGPTADEITSAQTYATDASASASAASASASAASGSASDAADSAAAATASLSAAGLPDPAVDDAYLKRVGDAYVPMTPQQVADDVGPLTAAGSTTVAGRVELATAAETAARAAAGVAVTPASLQGIFDVGSSVATTSGTAFDWTNIPAWVTEVTLVLAEVINSNNFLLQIGDSSGVATSGYTASAEFGGTGVTSSAGFIFRNGSPVDGIITLRKLTSANLWVATGVVRPMGSTGTSGVLAGDIALGATLDRIRLTAAGGGTFSGGSARLYYR